MATKKKTECSSCGKPRPPDSESRGWQRAICPECWPAVNAANQRRYQARQKKKLGELAAVKERAKELGKITPEDLGGLIHLNVMDTAEQKRPLTSAQAELLKEFGLRAASAGEMTMGERVEAAAGYFPESIREDVRLALREVIALAGGE